MSTVMIMVSLGISCLSLLLVLVVAFALLEVHHGLNQVRGAAGLLAEAKQVDVSAIEGLSIFELGIGTDLPDGAGLILFLSPKCSTCHSIALSFGGVVPPGLCIVLTATWDVSPEGWLREAGLPLESVRIDADQAIADTFGIDSTPTSVKVRESRVSGAFTTPSRIILDQQLRDVKRKDQDSTSEAASL